ncbi:MAG: S-adenosylmethionine synthase [Flavobacteria bacterium RIFCSPLOWO2_12_FULL_35_11]|nr:MAG: S-adenosylmethionine synthase [Flavobacteria bacterium RIFCSPLOWO2_12_FULL_35_11]
MTSFINIQSITEISTIEMAERKGIGHPDTICDHIAEQVSIALCNYYLKNFGSILHYNVDKALLVGGKSTPIYNGGKIIKPIELYIAGRATTEVKGNIIPVEEIAINAAKFWLSKNIRFLDVEKHISIIPKIRAGSNDLVELFQRFGKGEIPLSNDTSFGVGYYPYSPIEKNVLDIENLLNNKSTKEKFPFIGEDIKVMGVQNNQKDQFTIAIAIIDKFISSIEDYANKINSIKEFINTQFGFINAEIQINTADNYKTESVYLTVTGTSAEGGDDGQVGRGNRVNGLITPYRPMSLEASAGKNPVSHIGKIYNHFAFDLGRAVVENNFAEEANVFIVSQIGKPITQPQLLNIKLKNNSVDKERIAKFATDMLNELPHYWKKIINQ